MELFIGQSAHYSLRFDRVDSGETEVWCVDGNWFVEVPLGASPADVVEAVVYAMKED